MDASKASLLLSANTDDLVESSHGNRVFPDAENGLLEGLVADGLAST